MKCAKGIFKILEIPRKQSTGVYYRVMCDRRIVFGGAVFGSFRDALEFMVTSCFPDVLPVAEGPEQ